MLGTAELSQTKKVALSRSQDQYHECNDIKVTVLVFSCVLAVRVAYVPKYHC